jgi:hypothetical protein
VEKKACRLYLYPYVFVYIRNTEEEKESESVINNKWRPRRRGSRAVTSFDTVAIHRRWRTTEAAKLFHITLVYVAVTQCA